ncbi:outer membrane beta-barrel protein [Prevotella copri]|uniref:Outer membrane beta-barrel protein n=2 Tax=Segatella copri TaxID=165179 RepID=A0AB35ZBA3_9BACT|nr:TonB-dependent receptor [Segatella copri]MQN39661.1 outer membrane beta-barrel protein [Segatella copri]MQN44398.1 outer membrane beta-barrel protein [Segatella copri]MQN45417.1 outer membrane beta-barrel protein [Segatella copri]MQN66432.1 outer membrane beta-barrel protein [Segatella copri]MQN72418.1 outer membrane beta-barrel protein [Segatella copri]
MNAKRGIIVLGLLSAASMPTWAQQIKGVVIDQKSKETLIGAVVTVDGTNVKAITNIDGNFLIDGMKKDKTYTLYINYVGYKTQKIDGVQAKDADQVIALQPDEQQLKEVTVTAVERRNTDAAMIQVAKNSPVIVSNVSAQEISRTQDTNAGEVIRRVPGVSLIDDKFVMVRGLSQRYNNVWVNGGAVPSSEADSRAFSFDIIPSSQIDNLTIVKSPTAEYPADYSGGFIIVNTKEIPAENSFNIAVGGNWNTSSAFKDFSYSKGSGTDFLGFDNGLRNLNGGIHADLNPQLDANGKPVSDYATSLLGNGFNNDWLIKNKKPLGDLKLAASLNQRWMLGGRTLGMLAALNYTNEYRTYENMENNLYGIYDAANDKPNYLRHSVDDQYNNNVRLGAMINFTFLSKDGNHKYQLKNIFNQLATSRYTWRDGVSAQSNLERSAEYYYRSRTTYNGQLTGKHTFTSDALDWSIGYAYANRHLPDRRRYLIDDALESGVYALSTGNDISREWTQLDEHILSLGVNDKHHFKFGNFEPDLQVGAYGEYRSREYQTRNFIYNWNVSDNNMPSDFRHSDIPTLLSSEANMGYDKLYLLEEKQMRNNYRGHNTLGAGYLALSLPFGKLGIHAGVRFEHNDMELISNSRDYEKSESSRHYKTDDVFPSLNTTYKINDQHQVRLSYGRSINRPEFREASSSVYYDFDLASNVQGNTELKNCYVDNLDLRYEWYPSRGELISLAVFYKHFDSPIEWTYTVAGGTDLIYSYKNAKSANNYGVELDIRKNLGFIGLKDFSWSFNGALIKSKVQFEKGAKEEDRPMQGQSPYLINTGIFYKNAPLKMDIALLYNRIGKRIIGVGRSEGSTGDDSNSRVPHSYEMPRNTIDFSLAKKFGEHLELKLNVRDLLAEKIYYKQFADVTYSDGSKKEVEEIARCYKPGRNIGLQAIYKF